MKMNKDTSSLHERLTEDTIKMVARTLARSHGLGDHMPNIEPWMKDARTAVEATLAALSETKAENDLSSTT